MINRVTRQVFLVEIKRKKFNKIDYSYFRVFYENSDFRIRELYMDKFKCEYKMFGGRGTWYLKVPSDDMLLLADCFRNIKGKIPIQIFQIHNKETRI